MKFDDRMGIMYDTLFYGVIYFNQAKVKDLLEQGYTGTEDVLQYYEEVKKDMDDLPSCLYPFFFSDFSRMSFLIQFMLNKWDCRDATFEDYLDLLTHDEETKRIFLSHYIADRQTIDHYFETNDISPLIPKIIALDYNDTLKFDLLNTVASYDTTLTVLLDTLKSIHNCVDKLHKRLYVPISSPPIRKGLPLQIALCKPD